MEILHAGDLKHSIEKLVSMQQGLSEKDLEVYLRSLLATIYKYKAEKPTYALFDQIIKESLSVEALPFDVAWEAYTVPPFLNFEPDDEDYENTLIDPERTQKVSKFEVLEKTVMFQINDLRQSYTKKQKHHTGIEIDFSHVTSEPGEEYKELEDPTWNNFDIVSYLLEAVAPLSVEDDLECDWLLLTDLLEYGRTGGTLSEK